MHTLSPALLTGLRVHRDHHLIAMKIPITDAEPRARGYLFGLETSAESTVIVERFQCHWKHPQESNNLWD